jgi:hypothetical protein
MEEGMDNLITIALHYHDGLLTANEFIAKVVEEITSHYTGLEDIPGPVDFTDRLAEVLSRRE